MTRLGYAIGGLFALLGVFLLAITSFSFGERSLGEPERAGSRPPAIIPAKAGALAIPVQGFARSRLQNSWGDARGGGTRGHRGIDLMAAEGTPVIAVASGTVEKLFQSDLGGTTLYLRSADRRWNYYYAHLAGYAAGVREGLRVRPGQVLGYVGDTGDAGPGNHHLHFSASRMRPGERWWEGRDVNPYPMLAEREDRR